MAWVALGKAGHTWKKGLHLKIDQIGKKVNLYKNLSRLEKKGSHSLEKCQTWKNSSHLEKESHLKNWVTLTKKVTLGKMCHTCKN